MSTYSNFVLLTLGIFIIPRNHSFLLNSLNISTKKSYVKAELSKGWKIASATCTRQRPRKASRVMTSLHSTPEPLEQEGDWAAYWDENSQMVYYFNGESGESSWVPPTDTFPSIPQPTVGEVDEIVRVEEGKKSPRAFFSDVFEKLKFGKPTYEQKGNLSFKVSSKVLPHPEKTSWGGEDAVFVQGRTFGVFDGVSGAEKIEGMPLYSRTLAKEIKKSVSKLDQAGYSVMDIDSLTLFLKDAAKFANENSTGASTALIASLGEDNFLRVLNLGDGALIVIRDSRVVSRSRDIIHYFDCPYQLSSESPDKAEDGTKMNVEILQGDIIIAGSDGIFDNMENEDIISIISNIPFKANLIANAVTSESRKKSQKTDVETPYSKKSGGIGGKIDDISCVVLCVS